MYGYGWRPYVSLAVRRMRAARELQRARQKGTPVSPVTIEGRTIASTFWGKAWCDNLERYSDYENRLPRGRTYVRNGSVLDLQIGPGEVKALVSGSRLYRVTVRVAAVPRARWAALRRDCSRSIDSVVELLAGRFAAGTMERLCRPGAGLFPAPSEITFTCSCPDWAAMCKHVAAVFYGIGARLDARPGLLFTLRRIDERDLVAAASRGLSLTHGRPAEGRLLPADQLSRVFGLDLGTVARGGRPGGRRGRAGR